ncbi:hypothetical protein [Heyndrickxia oleronia]|uniref:hypothetical protein n=1 Tax=Heyndrickxia oleronia TaxID=38875 RepID=UPI0024692B73|nr:hypothetical protein [Heyndrickxia oleronia]
MLIYIDIYYFLTYNSLNASVAIEGKSAGKQLLPPGRKAKVSEAPKSKLAKAGEIPAGEIP